MENYWIPAIALGILIGNSVYVERLASTVSGAFVSPVLGTMSSAGAWAAGWYSVVPGAVLVGNGYSNDWFDGLFFVLYVAAGVFIQGAFLRNPKLLGVNYIVSAATLPLVVAILGWVFYATL